MKALTFHMCTEEEQQLYDPTGKGREFIKKLVDSRPNPQTPFTRKYSRGEWLRQYQQLRSRLGLHQALMDYDVRHDSKYAAQGGTYSLQQLVKSLSLYYTLANRPRWFRRVDIGVDYLCTLIREKTDRYGFPQPVPTEYQSTSAALPTMQKKGSFLAETVGFKTHRHAFPVLPGERIQRNSFRVIFQDACANVRYIEHICARIRNWLKKYFPHFFSAWLNPREYQNPTIYKILTDRRDTMASIETDYSKCDQHTSWELVSRTYMRIAKCLIPDEMEYLLFEQFVEELFEQPVYLGSVLVEGEHDLFSGQVITNDAETVYDVAVALGTLISTASYVDLYLLLANGDDLSVIMDRRNAQRVHDAMVEEMELNGHEISREKSRISTTDIQFCRRLYSTRCGPVLYNCKGEPYRMGFYPTSLALNGIVNQERPVPLAKQRAVILQRLDNTYGNTNFVPFVQFVGSRVDWQGFENDRFDTPTDWWERLYGERWNPTSSPSFKVLVKSGIIKKYPNF